MGLSNYKLIDPLTGQINNDTIETEKITCRLFQLYSFSQKTIMKT